MDRNGKVVFWSFVSMVLLIVVFYVYLIKVTTHNGVKWSKAEEAIASVGATVSDMESTYLSLKQSVTLSLAYAKGFEDVRAVRFIGAEKVGSVATASTI